jgi:hypothetical protein
MWLLQGAATEGSNNYPLLESLHPQFNAKVTACTAQIQWLQLRAFKWQQRRQRAANAGLIAF